MTDRENPTWSVVVQKEPRSRRNEDDYEEGVIGATGFQEPVTTYGRRQERNGATAAAVEGEGETVPMQEVAMVDAQMEERTAVDGYEDMEHADDDDVAAVADPPYADLFDDSDRFI